MEDGVSRAPCSSCRWRLVCPESEDRSPPPPPAAPPARKIHWREGFALLGVSILVFLVPFLMGFGISLISPRDLSVTEAAPSPTPFLAQVAPRPKYIAEK